MDFEPWTLWVIGGVVLLTVEMVTPGLFVFACFGVSAFIAAVASYFGVGVIGAWALFLVGAIALLVASQRWAAQFFKGRGRASNVDELIGKDALVLERIEPHHHGVVKIGGEVWRAESSATLEAKRIVTITAVEGTVVTVKPKEGV